MRGLEFTGLPPLSWQPVPSPDEGCWPPLSFVDDEGVDCARVLVPDQPADTATAAYDSQGK